MKRIFVLVALLAAVLPLGARPARPADYTVHIKDFTYKPAPLHVRAGQSVRFVNDDQEAHTVTAVDKSFDSTGLDTGDSWTYTFKKPGKYEYFCSLHPWMKAEILVTASKGGAS